MRILVLPLSALAVALTVSAQGNFGAATPIEPGVLYLPAALAKTIRAEKTHPGDPVRFRLDEPVLVAHGLVMPEGAVLRGRVMEASGLDREHASRLSIVVETAEWKHQKMPLHAYISGLVRVREVSQQRSADWRCQIYDDRREAGPPGHGSAQTATKPVPLECRNGWDNSQVDVVRERGADLKGILLRRDRQNGLTVLFSHKKNVHLESGTVLMLRNTPWQDQPGTETSWQE